MHRAFNRTAAILLWAGFAFAIIHAEAMLEAALRAIDTGIVAKRRAASFDGFFKHGADRVEELVQTLRGDAA